MDWSFLLRALQVLTLAHAFKSGLELFTSIVPAVLLTMDSHLSFSNWKGMSVKVVHSQVLSLFYERKLLNAIKNDNTFKGIQIHHKEFKLSPYAGHTTAFVSDTKSATNFIQTFVKLSIMFWPRNKKKKKVKLKEYG